MLKEQIIENLSEHVEILDKKFGYKKLWEELLISLAESEGKVASNQVQESLYFLLENLEIDDIMRALDIMADRIEYFPKEDFLKQMLYVIKEYCQEKENSIKEIKEVLAELATPTIRIWKDIVLVPLIGTLDSERAQTMAEKLLLFIDENKSKYVILDVTGVPYIDTVVGGFVLEMIKAVRFLGADVVITGIKPDIAHTLVKLGVDFNNIIIRRDLETALKYVINLIEAK